MLYRDTMLVVLRRWRLSIPLVIVGGLAAAGGYLATPPIFKDQIAVLFLVSSTSDKDGPINPYLNLSSALVASADIVRLSVTTPQSLRKLQEGGGTADFDVALDTTTPAPVLNITSTGRNSDVVSATTKAVLKRMNDELVSRQTAANAARSTWIQTTVISSLDEPQRSSKLRLQIGMSAGAGTVLLGLLSLFSYERRRQARTKRPDTLQISSDDESIPVPTNDVPEVRDTLSTAALRLWPPPSSAEASPTETTQNHHSEDRDHTSASGNNESPVTNKAQNADEDTVVDTADPDADADGGGVEDGADRHEGNFTPPTRPFGIPRVWDR